MTKGFKAELDAVPSFRQKDCKKELYYILGLKSRTQFYRKKFGITKLNPAEIKAVKEVISKYKN